MLNERQECEWIGLGKQRHQEEVAENRGWVEQKKNGEIGLSNGGTKMTQNPI